jgi:hypothetical protein
MTMVCMITRRNPNSKTSGGTLDENETTEGNAAMLVALADRISMLEDERDIGELFARYAHMIDHDQTREWVDCFTPDGRFEVRRPGAEPRVLVGHEALSDFATSRPPRPVPTKHFSSQLMINVDGDTASATSYFALLSDTEGDPALVFYGRYVDELVRGSDRRWRFASRRAGGESRRG